MMRSGIVIILSILISFSACSSGDDESESSGQQAQKGYNPVVENSAYESGGGPVIFIDEAHHNFHTLNGRYAGFAKLLILDGYRMEPYTSEFNLKDLNKGKILVISNALNERNVEDWSLPTPSAFTEDEIRAVVEWVKNGGSLFLIADHMPMPGAAADLALAFGFEFINGFALDTSRQGGDLFCRATNTLADNAVTNGRNKSEIVDSVLTMTGQAFNIPKDAIPILTLDSRFTLLIPEEAWEFDDNTKIMSAEGMFQGAVMKFGQGRIAVFGEAAEFTAQEANGRIVGMGSPDAPNNEQFLLNIIHWLDGLIE